MPHDLHAPRDRPRSKRKHSEAYPRDPAPNANAQPTPPDASAAHSTGRRSDADVKELVTFLTGFTMDEMRQIPIVDAGERLTQGSTYVDLTSDTREPFTATGDMVARDDGQWLVPKADTPYMIWNRLIHAEPPERRE
jgi:hypothetical protein